MVSNTIVRKDLRVRFPHPAPVVDGRGVEIDIVVDRDQLCGLEQ
jgi:hypothetical protein